MSLQQGRRSASGERGGGGGVGEGRVAALAVLLPLLPCGASQTWPQQARRAL